MNELVLTILKMREESDMTTRSKLPVALKPSSQYSINHWERCTIRNISYIIKQTIKILTILIKLNFLVTPTDHSAYPRNPRYIPLGSGNLSLIAHTTHDGTGRLFPGPRYPFCQTINCL